MKRDFQASSPHRLVYRDGSHSLIGIPLVILGLSAIVGTGKELVRRWPNDSSALSGGLIFALVLFGVGAKLFSRRQVVFDKSVGQIIQSSRFLLWQRSKTHELSGFDAVSWNPKHTSEETVYLVRLTGPGSELQIFENRILDDARSLTRDVGEFLGLKQEHWDARALSEQTKCSSSSRVVTLWRTMAALVGRQPMRLVTNQHNQLQFTQSFDTMLKVIGLGFTSIGLVFIPWLGIKIDATDDAPWLPPLLGSVFAVLGAVFLLGRRGISIDKQRRLISFWWGLILPIWSRRHELSSFSAVRLDRQIKEKGGRPTVVHGVLLTGDHGKQLPVFESLYREETASLARQVADFLGYDITLEPETKN